MRLLNLTQSIVDKYCAKVAKIIAELPATKAFQGQQEALPASCGQTLGRELVEEKGRKQVVNKFWDEQVSDAIRQLVLWILS
ncbi:hypothetical protein Y032_0441g1524 [Ancylostoma ceylanicum]|uniref:Uncharacterized protein n=1 Tax=Ancylostoma ceylanicum TaxID=53326 RepID=A0A016WZQ8_9BILA|nr:hypothetical protein Y032_0441g1524 [Ancylostoma ceylanicum]